MSFANREYTIPAGGSVTFNVKANAFTILHADLPINVGFDDGAETERVEQGLGIPVLGGFEKIRFENPNASNVYIRVAFNDTAIIDNRLTASSDLKVVDPGGGGESFSEVIAKVDEVLAMMQNADDQRSSISEIGSSFLHSVAASGVVMAVDPSLNVNGAILRFISAYSASGPLVVFTGASAPTGWNDTSKRRIFEAGAEPKNASPINLKIDAGNGVWVAVAASTARYGLGWDYLP